MSDANRTLLSYVKEVTYGVTPTTPTLIDVRYTSETLKPDAGFVISPEIEASRQLTDRIRVAFRANGDVGYALSYGGHDPWFEYSLFSPPWTTPIPVTITSTVTVPGGIFTVTRSAGSFVTDLFAVGQWVELRLHANAGNNGYAKIATVSALVLTFSASTGTPVAEGPTAGVSVEQLGQILAGTVPSSISIEKASLDLTNVYQQMTGVMFTGFTLQAQAGGILTGQFNTLGQDYAGSASSLTGTAHTAAATNPVMNAVDNAIAVFEGGLRVPLFSVNLTHQNNLRERLILGQLGPESIGTGSIDVQVTMQGYFSSLVQLNKFIANTPTSAAIVFEETPASKALIFDLPRGRITAYAANATAINTDVMAVMTYGAYRHPTELQTFRIARAP